MQTKFRCADCDKDPGFRTIGGYAIGEKTYPLERIGTCRTCKGEGMVIVDSEAIAEAIKGRKGLRTNKPTADIFGAAYVWRMARFHGGIDTTMPITCYFTVGIGGLIPAYAREMLDALDALADEAAKKYCGTDLGAARRWAGLV